MVINSNIQAQTSARMLGESTSRLSKSLSRLSSGSRIVSPEDDAAGMAVSMRFDAQINRTGAAINNLGNTLSFCQTQDGYLQKIGKALDRMSELAMLAQDVTKTDTDRGLYNQEFQTLSSYINSVVTEDFNGVTLFSSSAQNVTIDSDGVTLQMAGISGTYLAGSTEAEHPPSSATIGSLVPGMTGSIWTMGHGGGIGPTSTNTLQEYVHDFNIVFAGYGSVAYDPNTGALSVTLEAGEAFHFEDNDNNPLSSFLGLNSADLDNSGGSAPKTVTATLTIGSESSDISTASGAAEALTTVKSAINQLATDRATVGATMSRLNSTSETLGMLKENLSAANSRIKDVDVAEESTQFARYNILVQSGTAMLAQANVMPNNVLRLLS